MGKSSKKKKRERQQQEMLAAHHYQPLSHYSKPATFTGRASPLPPSHPPHATKADEFRIGKPELENVTSTGGRDESTFASRQRTIEATTFVYPRENGVATPYEFGSERQILGAVEQAQESLGVEVQRDPPKSIAVKESIQQIFAGKRKHGASSALISPEEETKGSLSGMEVNNLEDRGHRGRSDSVDDGGVSMGRLSGLSVEEVVRDKGGLRPRANSTDGELNLPRRGLCDERLVLETFKWKLLQFGNHQAPKGFSNLGNTCFLNSTLQCLAYLPPFCQSLVSMPSTSDVDSNGGHRKLTQGKQITFKLRSLFCQMYGLQGAATTNGSAIAPHAIVKSLPLLGSCGSRNGYKFRPGRQEDAHEFLLHLLDAMNVGELSEAGINQHTSGWRERLPVPRLDETTFIHRIFGGYLRSQVRCTACGHRSNTYDPFLDLSLEVSHKSCQSLHDALQEFTRKETLDSANRWKCTGCKKRVCATKQLTVFRPPLALCIQLKRFSYGSRFGVRGGFVTGMCAKLGGGHGGSKISKPIAFPSVLKLALSDKRSCGYALSGVVIHVGGSASSGHYTAYIKKPSAQGTGQWFHLDDSFAEPVSEKTVVRQRDAYLLFYSREEVQVAFPSPPLRSFMTADDATEFGRKRARARADSITENLISSMLENGEEKGASPDFETDGTKYSFASSFSLEADKLTNRELILTTKQTPHTTFNSSHPAPPRQSVSASITINRSLSEQSNVLSVAKPQAMAMGDTNRRSSASSLQAQPSAPATISNVPNEKELAAAPSTSSSEVSTDDTTSNEGDIVGMDDSTDANSPPIGPRFKSQPNPPTAEARNKQRSQLSSDKDSEKKMAPVVDSEVTVRKTTRLVLDRGEGSGKVEVILGPRIHSKAWTPPAPAPRQDRSFELLGNRAVDRWDENGDAESRSDAKTREHVVKSLHRVAQSRKRSMFLDRYDAMLDRGKTKKVKDNPSADPTESSDAQNRAFQRIQLGLQRMNKGRAKGLVRQDRDKDHKSKWHKRKKG